MIKRSFDLMLLTSAHSAWCTLHTKNKVTLNWTLVWRMWQGVYRTLTIGSRQCINEAMHIVCRWLCGTCALSEKVSINWTLQLEAKGHCSNIFVIWRHIRCDPNNHKRQYSTLGNKIENSSLYLHVLLLWLLSRVAKLIRLWLNNKHLWYCLKPWWYMSPL
jgi:hypothetical protein